MGDPGSIPGSGRTGGENGSPLQHSYLENSMDKGRLVGYSPWGRKNSDMAEQLTNLYEASFQIKIFLINKKALLDFMF